MTIYPIRHMDGLPWQVVDALTHEAVLACATRKEARSYVLPDDLARIVHTFEDDTWRFST